MQDQKRQEPGQTAAPGSAETQGRVLPLKPAAAGATAPQRPPAPRSRMCRRHWGMALSFLLLVALPTAVTAWYLWTRAADQYASYTAFSVRKEEVNSTLELFGGVTALSGSSSSDIDVLYEYLLSQGLVADLDRTLDLRAIWSRGDPLRDPVFAYHSPGTIEDLVAYWPRMVRISYDGGTGLIGIRVLAFDPDDAQRLSTAIYDRSTAMINELSAVARKDTIRYARDELDEAVERLKLARQAVTEFRNRTRIVDPEADIRTQVGLLATLQEELAATLIELDVLRQTTRQGDPRITQTELKVRVIEGRIEGERQKLGIGAEGDTGEAFATLMGEYERLMVDRQFAEETYTAALAAYDSARSEARRKSRYLAAHVRPTRAEASVFPRRGLILGLLGLFLFLGWSILALLATSLHDRR